MITIPAAVAALLVTSTVLAQQPPAAVGGTSQPPCPIAEDEKYAFTPEQPVQVGGSPMYGAARQRRYLDALRGPGGERVQYKRRGAHEGPDGTILDAYEVSYEGRDKPVTLYLDWYHYDVQKAPRGFTCGQPIGLGLPPLNPFQETEDLVAVAVTQGSSRDFAPIPLGADGSTTHGVIYDRFRVLAHAARKAAAAGAPLDAQNPPRELMQVGSVILIYPLTCGDSTVRAGGVDVVAPDGSVLPANRRTVLDEQAAARLLPGIQPPAGTLAIGLPFSAPRLGDTIRITYTELCGASGDQVSLALKGSPARGIDMPNAPLPAGMKAAQPVLLQVFIDPDGTLQRSTYVGGPAALAQAAADAVRRWRFEPGRVNGAPLTTATYLQVRFVDPR
jgi:hypothetical protein